jgi:hypothetical protein
MVNNIEFIGPSGAGKTTLFYEVLSRRKGKGWFTPEEALFSIGIGKKGLTSRQKVRLLQLNLGLTRNPNRIIQTLLSNDINVALHETMPLYNELIELYMKSKVLRSGSEPYRNLISFEWYYNKLLKELVYIKHFRFKELVVYHDGFIHTSPIVESDEQSSKDLFEKIIRLLNPKAIVYCNISLEENIMRRKNRIYSNKGNFIEVGLNDQQLRRISEISIQTAKYKVDLLEKLGFPIIEVNMEDISESDIGEINDFINNFI